VKGADMRDLTEFSHLETEYLRMKPNRIGLLGGTFNPIHNGHLKMAYIALYEFGLGEIVFLPLGTPPHKRDEFVAGTDHRLEMIRIAIAGEKRFSLSTLETDRKGYTYTIDTLEQLARCQKQTAYYYIIGADTLFELENWRHYERVFILTDFICILRPGQDVAKVRQQAQRLNERFGHKIHIANECGPSISSSLIRKQMTANKLADGLVPRKVAQYIVQNRVYHQGV
jgi:nicotinate-nucleotide adenylyltransferase